MKYFTLVSPACVILRSLLFSPPLPHIFSHCRGDSIIDVCFFLVSPLINISNNTENLKACFCAVFYLQHSNPAITTSHLQSCKFANPAKLFPTSGPVTFLGRFYWQITSIMWMYSSRCIPSLTTQQYNPETLELCQSHFIFHSL